MTFCEQRSEDNLLKYFYINSNILKEKAIMSMIIIIIILLE